jgi:hypothetical protein
MNSKRLFVTKDDAFTLKVLFTKDGTMKVSKEADVPEKEREVWEKFEVEFVLPDFGTAKGIMRAALDNDKVNIGQFNNALLCSLARKWNLLDEEGKEIPLDLSKLNELRPDITRMFVELLQEKLSKEGLYDAILFS